MSSPSANRFLGLGTLLVWVTFGVLPAQAQVGARQRDMPTSMRGFLGIQLIRDSLPSVEARLGSTEGWHTGDASTGRFWWCYRTSTDSSGAVLLISSDGEMGGEESTVDDIRLIRAGRADSLAQRCARIVADRPSNPGGLHLGLTRAQVVHLLGQPSAQDPDSIGYRWVARRFLSPKEPDYEYWNERREACFGGERPYVDISSAIVLRFDALGAYEIQLSRNDPVVC